MDKTKDHFVTVVEGNIASGKSTLLDYFKDNSNCEVVPEPLDQWQNVNGENLYDLVHKDAARWGATTQSYIQLTMAQSHVRPQTERVRLMERSLFSGRYCFIDNLLQGGKMTTIEHSVLSQWHDWIVDSLQIKVDLYVYLRTDPRVIPDRILKRGRVEEKDIPMKYIESIHDQHEDLFIRGMKVYKPNVLVLDANCSKDEMVQLYERHRDQILHTGANSHLPPVQN